MSEAFGEALRRERRRRRETQAEAAARFGVKQPSYHRWESGNNNPDATQYAQVADYLGISVSELHQLLYNELPPASIEELRERLDAIERDIADFRTQMRDQAKAIGPYIAMMTAAVEEAMDSQTDWDDGQR